MLSQHHPHWEENKFQIIVPITPTAWHQIFRREKIIEYLNLETLLVTFCSCCTFYKKNFSQRFFSDQRIYIQSKDLYAAQSANKKCIHPRIILCTIKKETIINRFYLNVNIRYCVFCVDVILDIDSL